MFNLSGKPGPLQFGAAVLPFEVPVLDWLPAAASRPQADHPSGEVAGR